MTHKGFDTSSQAINDLVKRGYTANLSLSAEKDCLICHSPTMELSPDDFEIDEVYRFDGMTNPSDESIVYGISSKKHEIKGVIVNSYGVYADRAKSQIVKKLNDHSN
ncbi:phosphoribosylpyrophosphate synthetase [Cryomorpha ignava]|uniref:Phosphoribosylpyrophosphate synthetase n=1 Tax=Cryomorpha ignava TaxID=101383 RepID=A0A7K3WV96_9FLAO|nr:phosphoribosylpyrophosphate synthetase [Cryomorpha ignava]NEN25448.1 phosphoribosylpyrophosphate synthetase [Cryomorpha ignava]